MPATLQRYRAKRDFDKSPEPRGAAAASGAERIFVIQKHAATRLHYDFRLELDGVLVSWAVPKGPSLDPADKRMAIHVEDHPLDYAGFEGTIPPKQYGAGKVIVWDRGTWEPVGDPRQGMADGKLVFHLHGDKLGGLWELVDITRPNEDRGTGRSSWLLLKKRDAHARARSDFDVLTALPDSVITAMSAGEKAPLFKSLKPQLATLARQPPSAGDWLYEAKLDGYRLLTRIERGRVTLLTRSGLDWTAKMPQLAQALSRWSLDSAWLDGEIVILDDAGVPDFGALQNAFDARRAETLVYFVFDLPYLDGIDRRALPLRDRKRLLKQLLDDKADDPVRYCAELIGNGAAILQAACEMKLEGVIAKRADAPYVSGRSDAWLKLKCRLRQELIVAGCTERADGTAQIGSLLLGVRDGQGLVSVGRVGTGWSADEAHRLHRLLSKIEVDACPFTDGPPAPGRWSRPATGSVHWVQPKHVAEVDFAAWTADQQIRQASFIALRTDKRAASVVRERPAPSTPMKKITHADRVIDKHSGLTKLDLVRYVESVADRLLPHLADRPLSLLRAPNGLGGKLFFQKHDEGGAIAGVEALANPDPKDLPLMLISTRDALLNAAQLNVVEFHTGNARRRNLAKPDRMVFDLDPGEGLPWRHMQDGALLVRTLLDELGLQCWLKTSGGKGLHVVVPCKPTRDFATLSDFSRRIVEHLARTLPSRFVAKSGPKNRVGKIFVDYLRNRDGATTVAAFSARARPGLGVSMPIGWDDLDALERSDQWTIADAREHLSFERADPWADYWTTPQTLTAAIKALRAATHKGKA